MAGDGEFNRPDNFFGILKTELCECGHHINVTDPSEHTCRVDCDCNGCKQRINRQLRVIEED